MELSVRTFVQNILGPVTDTQYGQKGVNIEGGSREKKARAPQSAKNKTKLSYPLYSTPEKKKKRFHKTVLSHYAIMGRNRKQA